jgi:hypothetical protein
MPLRCGGCRSVVAESAKACPYCGAPRTRFRTPELYGGEDNSESAPAAATDSATPTHLPLGTRARAGIAIAVVVAVATGFVYYSKHSYLENHRLRCVAIYDRPERCDCIASEIDKHAYAISFVPWLRVVAAVTGQRLDDIYREAAMTCVEPR